MGSSSSSNNDNTRYVASVVALYWFVSISMVYLNKVLMSGGGMISIPAPIFVTWFQCVVTAIICYIAGNISDMMKHRSNHLLLPLTATTTSPTSSSATTSKTTSSGGSSESINKGHTTRSKFFSQFPKAEYDVKIGTKIFPLSLIFVGMITFNNLCLRYVEVSFYNVARSLTIVFNVILSSTFLGSKTSPRTLSCLGIVILGFFMGIRGETNFSRFGTMAGVCSSLFVSLNSIFTKKVLPVVDNDHWKLTFYNNVNAVVLFIPLMVYFELDTILEAINQQFTSIAFWIAMLVAGIFGFSIGIVTVLQIKATSPLSHNMSGTAKAAVQSMMAFYIWKNPATFVGVLGMLLVLGGSLLYTITKMKEAIVPRKTTTSKSSTSSSAVAASVVKSGGAGSVVKTTSSSANVVGK